MQHLIDRKREPLRPRLVRSALPLAATLLAALTLSLIGARQQRGLDAMQAEIDSLAIAEGRANELRLQMAAARAKTAQLSTLAQQLSPQIGGDVVARLGQCMPGDVWLHRLEISDRARIRLEGASYLEAGVYDFVRWLEEAPGMREVALKRTHASSSISGPTTGFELEVILGESDVSVKKVARHE
jgi:Tfp pilus assembly protein PilN